MIWNHFYSTGSARDAGTLYAMRNAMDASNVSNDPHNRYYAASEFLDKVTNAYLINGALAHFGMENKDDKCTRNIYGGLHLDGELSKKAYAVRQVISYFVDQHINVPVLCGNTKKRSMALRNLKDNSLTKSLKAKKTKLKTIPINFW